MAPRVQALGVGIVLGAFAWPYCQPDAWACAAGAAVLGALAWFCGYFPSAQVLAIFTAGTLVGAGRVARLPAGPAWSGQVALRGVVATPATGRAADVLVPNEGTVRVIFPSQPPKLGRIVLLSGTAFPVDPTQLPGEPDPTTEWARSGIQTQVLAHELITLGALDPEPDFSEAAHAGLLAALITGDTAEIPKEEAALLRRTGTWHLVSVSGLHVGFGAVAGWWAGWLLGRPLTPWLRRPQLRWLNAAGGMAGAWAYAGLADWATPASRAAWMASAACVVWASSRRPNLPRILGFAAIALVWAAPECVGEVGFQLSFGAMLGMLWLVPRLLAQLPPDQPRLVKLTAEALAASAGATIGTLPAVALHFQSLSPLSPLANLWAVPWIGTVATPLALAAWVLPGAVGAFALCIADAATEIGLRGISWLDVPTWAPAVGAWGALGLGIAAVCVRRPVLSLVGALALLCGRTGSPRELVVTFLAVGQGDATFIEWPDGSRWLVDGGPPGTQVLQYLRRRHIERLNAVFLSHAHPDHFGGLLPVLESIPVDTLVTRGLVAGMDLGKTGHWTTRHGALLPLSNDWDTPNENDRSLVIHFGLGERSFLLPGDAEMAEESALVATDCQALASDVLKVGHHGSRTSSTAPFLGCVHPEMAVIMSGFLNRYGHPHAGTLRTLHTALFAPQVWRTDRDGSVEVRTDGDYLHVSGLGAPTSWRLRGPG